jgi:hypothetical protein
MRTRDLFDYKRGPGMKWIVERAGGLAPGTLAPGWMSINPFDGSGAWFPTWEEAYSFTLDRALKIND